MGKSTQVRLSEEEMLEAIRKACVIRINHLRNEHTRETFNVNENEGGWNRAIEGALGEFAVAKFLGLPFPQMAVGVYNETDVGEIFEVRTTAYRSGRLIINPSGKDDTKLNKIFILVTGLYGTYTLRGWCYGKDRETIGEWTKPDPKRPFTWMVPQARLHDPQLLLDHSKVKNVGVKEEEVIEEGYITPKTQSLFKCTQGE